MANTTQFFYEVLIMFALPNNPRITCSDGFDISVQARDGSYCTRDDNGTLTKVECGFPSTTPKTEALKGYAELCGTDDYTDTVYGFVPVEVVQAELDAHGGIITGVMPS